jgi:hypothetical protein
VYLTSGIYGHSLSVSRPQSFLLIPINMSTTAIFQSSRTAGLVPKDARNKKQLRLVIAAFAEQFASALSNRLVTYCRLSKTKTVTASALQDVAEELLGAGSSTLPADVDESRLPQTIIYSRFKRNLGGLRTDSKCASVAAIVGAHFLRYVNNLIQSVYDRCEDPRAVTVEQVIASLERPGKYAPSGLPCIAYRHSDAIFAAAQNDAAAAADEQAAAAAPSEPKKKAKKARAAEEAPAAAAAAAPENEKKAKKRARASDEAAPVEAPAPTKAAGKKAAKKEQVAEKAPAEEAPAEKKRRPAVKKAAAPAVTA